ncbi:hypothetical protein L6164_007275 [Bauhinia variegata]|uniref:Uncharacterized protein n=1 Tax=Bauhinia variegata TaxID=167791 RepID=A0ACB9PDD0_BAUVA|nr:hypothetical protein L6164_007275 [Bauhinia variegata]
MKIYPVPKFIAIHPRSPVSPFPNPRTGDHHPQRAVVYSLTPLQRATLRFPLPFLSFIFISSSHLKGRLKEMGSRGLLLKRGSYSSSICSSSHFGFPKAITDQYKQIRSCSSTTRSSLQPPDVPRLAETARISLTSTEIEDFAPKIKQVIDWFGQLQGVDLQSIEPFIRADAEANNSRDDVPETFENRDNIVAAVPNYEKPYIKVPRVLNTE